MANNRLYLVHKQSGFAIGLGKRMGWEWCAHGPIEKARLDRFFFLAGGCNSEADQDGFAVILESDPRWRVAALPDEDRIYKAEPVNEPSTA
jgi:hypothetical protein